MLGLSSVAPLPSPLPENGRCRNCNNKLAEEQPYCQQCGTLNPPDGCVDCSQCSRKIPIHVGFCGYCGARNPVLAEPQSSTTSAPPPSAHGSPVIPQETRTLDFSGMPWLSAYYRREFQKIFETQETYQGRWNWAAFFFGGIWALTKGLWAPVLLCVVISVPLGGIPAILFWAYFAARGNFLYYKKVVKQQSAALF